MKIPELKCISRRDEHVRKFKIIFSGYLVTQDAFLLNYAGYYYWYCSNYCNCIYD